MLETRRFCAVFSGWELVDASDGISAKEIPHYKHQPCVVTEFFETEDALKTWLLENRKKPDLAVYQMESMDFNVSLNINPSNSGTQHGKSHRENLISR